MRGDFQSLTFPGVYDFNLLLEFFIYGNSLECSRFRDLISYGNTQSDSKAVLKLAYKIVEIFHTADHIESVQIKLCRLSELYFKGHAFYLLLLIGFAGTPAAMMYSDISFVTTDPAATIELSPILTPATIIELDPNHTSLPITISFSTTG